MRRDPDPWVVHKTSYRVVKAPFVAIREHHLVLPNGQEIPDYWIFEWHPWVNVIALTPSQEIILTRQYRPGVAQVHYELPGGVVDPGDTVTPDEPSLASPPQVLDTSRPSHPDMGWANLQPPSSKTLEVAARRELVEETGYAGGTWRHFSRSCSNPASQDNWAHTFLADGVTLQQKPDLDDTEQIEVHLLSLEALENQMASGGFAQAMHLAALYRFLFERTKNQGVG